MSAVEGNYTVSLRKLLIEGGIWMDFPKEKYGFYFRYFQISRFVFCLAVWLLVLWTLVNEGPEFLFKPPAIFIPLGGVLITSTFLILIKSSKLHRLVDQCEVNLSSYTKSWELEIVRGDTQRLNTFINFGKFSFLNFALLYIFLPLIVDGIRAVMGYEDPYYLPIPLEGYLGPNPSRSLHYYMIILTCDLWFLVAITLTNAFEGLVLFIVSYNIIELKILKQCVKNLESQTEKFNDDGVQLLPPWDLREIIRYHKKILRLNFQENKCITPAYIMQNLTCTLSIAFIVFMIRQLVGENTMMLFLSVTFVGMVVVMLFMVCFAGEIIQSESLELFSTLYNIPWYRQSPRVRKDILIIMTQLSKPLVLDYKQNVINLPVFMQIINNSYSFFMLMTSVKPA
uniref:Odorant receptor n=1 Tax=Yemma signatus TaxID=300820 RepID=A0A385H5F3_9HEMI|nr:odorant receptor [Yemma signatus]